MPMIATAVSRGKTSGQEKSEASVEKSPIITLLKLDIVKENLRNKLYFMYSLPPYKN